MADSSDELRRKVAIAIRVFAMQGCVTDIMGHVSARIPDTSEMFIRLGKSTDISRDDLDFFGDVIKQGLSKCGKKIHGIYEI